jgi:hypothetical protein
MRSANAKLNAAAAPPSLCTNPVTSRPTFELCAQRRPTVCDLRPVGRPFDGRPVRIETFLRNRINGGIAI